MPSLMIEDSKRNECTPKVTERQVVSEYKYLRISVDLTKSKMQVGHQIVVSYAKCMGLPLFRRRIQGSTRQALLQSIA
ncbi:hypothetical protein MTR67_016795 [Solanum verrucosum]|uniref:Uncharacterized protein n=1 Tax=Solanum verrucosum TaxID=315347 RepID=A0AAF0TRN4_SOLVR|nr:hypothetical protein MTR67_016795 [Solanum verrucosum]